jgi:fumarate hydratase subunit alpha
MADINYKEIENKAREALIDAGSTFRPDLTAAYEQAIQSERDERAKWIMEQILENSKAAYERKSPLCDDSGIPHAILYAGPGSMIDPGILKAVEDGVKAGLRELPGRPMAVKGEGGERIAQSEGLSDDPADMLLAPVMVVPSDEEGLKLTVLMEGGGPEIRSKTNRVFHKHSTDTVIDEIIEWATESVAKLGCTPVTLAVGIGRTHYEASSLMLQAMAEGDRGVQSELEKRITAGVNASGVGPLGLGGDTTVLGTFLKIGPQRASGVRIVSMRPCCCFEPRAAEVKLI